MNGEERVLTIPNFLSFYRLCAAPVAAWMAIDGQRTAFAVLIAISLASDIMDGIIARAFNQKTVLGARLDSFADMFTLLAACLGVVMFEWTSIKPDMIWLILFGVCFALSTLVPVVRFGRPPAFHLYSFRINGYILGAFFFTLFVFGYYKAFFIFAMVVGSVASLEVVAVALTLEEFKTDQRGLYWVLRNRSQMK